MLKSQEEAVKNLVLDHFISKANKRSKQNKFIPKSDFSIVCEHTTSVSLILNLYRDLKLINGLVVLKIMCMSRIYFTTLMQLITFTIFSTTFVVVVTSVVMFCSISGKVRN